LCLAWAIAPSDDLQWAIVIVVLIAWNYLLVRSGERKSSIELRHAFSSRELYAALAVGIALLILATVVAVATEEFLLYPGREAIRFALVGIPTMVWANRSLARIEARQRTFES
jgi:hypothetical protein